MPVNNLIQLRRGSDWSSNPILASGEPGFDISNNILKIGDGQKTWSELSSINGAGSGTNISVTGSSILDYGNLIAAGNTTISLDGNNIVISGGSSYAFREYEDVTTTKTIFNTSQSYISGNLDVYYNGLKLLINEDYVANGGTSFTLLDSAASGDVVEWVGGYTGSSFFQDVGGSGTANYISKWKDKNTLTSGIIYDDGTKIGIGTTNPIYLFDVAGSGSFDSLNINDAFTFPTGAGSVGDSLVYAGSNQVAWSGVSGGGGLTCVSGNLCGNLNLNSYDILGTGNIAISGNVIANSGTLDVLSFNINNESILTKGQISWDDTEGVISMGLTDTLTTYIGEQRFYRVRNKTGSPLYKGQVVYATGVHSNGLITPAKYIADNSIAEVRFIGVVLETVNDNNNGYVADFGHINEIDLRGNVASNYAVGDETWLAGDILYAHPTVSGKLTKVKPKHNITVAIILDNSSNGKMFVRPTTFGDLDDNHTVNTSGVTNGQFLQYNATTDYWVPSSSGNFTTLQVNGTLVPTGVGTSNYVTKWTGANSLGSGIIYDNGTNVGIGTASPQAKLDVNGSGHFQDNISIGLTALTNDFGLEIYRDKPNLIQRLSNPSGSILQGNWYGDDEVRFASIAHYGPSYSDLSAFNIGASGSVFVSYEADIGIGSLNNDSLIFGTYNIERARITPGGYFGIGTDNPTNKLQVENGNVVINDSGGTYDFRVEGDADPQLLTVKGSAGTDKVGIGCSPSVGKLHIQALYTNNNGHDAIYSDQRNTSSSNGTYSNAGIDLLSRKLVNSGVSDTGQIVGADLVATLDGDGSLNNSYGARTWGGIYINASGSLTNAWGIHPRVINGGHNGASITNAYGVDIFIDGDLYDRIDGDSITTAMGLRIRNIEHATNSWAIYQEGANDANYFAGNVGIGTASLAEKLHVNGNVLVDNSFYTSPTGTIVGTSGWIYQSGQVVNSQGSFGTHIGDAQNSVYILRGSTTNATFITIQNNGSDVILASNRTMMFTANIVGRRTNGADNAAYKLEGMLYNDGYGASIIGTPVKTIIGETDSSWDVQATISGAGAGGSDYLNIQVKGASSKNINWVAKLEILEVGGDITGYTEANILGIDSSIIP